MEIVGNVQNIVKESNFEWKIENFFSLSKEYYSCPSFSFADGSWCLGIYPNRQTEENSAGSIGLYLIRKLDGPPISLKCALALKTSEGKKDRDCSFTHVFEKPRGHGYPNFMTRSALSKKKSDLMPSHALTIVCNLEYYCKSKEDAGNVGTAYCSHCQKPLDAEFVSCHEKKCLDQPVKCPSCGNVFDLRNWIDHECDTARIKATEKLVEDLSGILENEEHSDVTIRVKDKEFHLHRNILAGRNLYFNTMFKTDMKEKNTGIVSIDDCEPDIFSSFINFVYTGEVRALSSENVGALYEVADKYQEDQLKNECLCFMKKEISVESFCDFIGLALQRDEKELFEKATDLFCRKTKEIIQSAKWQTFLREYPTMANELHIKALDYFFK